MKIAVDTRHLDHLEGYGYFLWEAWKRVTKKNPAHEFIFIFDRPCNTKFLLDKNVIAVVTGPVANHPLVRKFWYDVKVPALLRKYKADLFIAGDGICSLTTPTPQCLIVNDLSFLFSPSFSKRAGLFFFKRYTKKFLQKANSIVTFSEFVKKDIVSQYAIKEEKITVVYPACKEIFCPLSDIKKEEIKKRRTGGKNYFLYAGVIHPRKNLANLLKAFSIFKKRQKSDWKLVLAGGLAHNYKSFAAHLNTYKYRDDVIMTGCLEEEEMAALTGAAYAMIDPCFWKGSAVQALAAMNSHIPLIASGNLLVQEIAGEAALYVNPAEPKDIADKMMLLYKDEPLRSSIIEKGKIIAAQYNWEKTADLFWQGIIKARAMKETQ